VVHPTGTLLLRYHLQSAEREANGLCPHTVDDTEFELQLLASLPLSVCCGIAIFVPGAVLSSHVSVISCADLRALFSPTRLRLALVLRL
jgi:hypothetical protein